MVILIIILLIQFLDNDFGSKAIIHLSQSLITNTTVKYLSLNGNIFIK